MCSARRPLVCDTVSFPLLFFFGGFVMNFCYAQALLAFQVLPGFGMFSCLTRRFTQLIDEEIHCVSGVERRMIFGHGDGRV